MVKERQKPREEVYKKKPTRELTFIKLFVPIIREATFIKLDFNKETNN